VLHYHRGRKPRLPHAQNDRERERFIEHSGGRAILILATGENAYRAEHYRRHRSCEPEISAATRSGLRTARGRFYITLGKPDESKNFIE